MGGEDTAVLAEGEKAVPTRVAAVGREVQQAPQPGEAAAYVLTGNALQVKIPALRAMGKGRVGNRHHPGEKPRLASPTTPGTKTSHPGNVVPNIAAL